MNRVRVSCPAWLVLFAAALPLVGQGEGTATSPFRQPVRIGTLPKKTIPEASGIASSRRYEDLYWTHNDSGGKAEIFAVRRKGDLVRRIAIPWATNNDWEDIAIDHQNRLVVADLGDNFAQYKEHTLYRFAEPDPAGDTPVTDIETFRFAYPAELGRLDAEAFFLREDWAFVLTKQKDCARLFRISLRKPSGRDEVPIAAELVGSLGDLTQVTSASLSDDGRHLAALTYQGIVVLDLAQALQPKLPAADLLNTLQAAERREKKVFLGQCEGVTWHGTELVVCTEQGPFQWGTPVLWQITPNLPNGTTPGHADGMK
ncbi:MAG: hypothetical protein IT456_05080 [Planctomycetes bacterium]|nr:hypothetical protein [Planctomycetota bacterium]